ncbi:Complement C3 Complement C3 beta chain Complement C3 alpha chain [Channa argus]|uniref:Complement C3 Complement C3 beta chain Complement C3 alpha chain n=1 Tax=Channa argus TaxID=215402 RepID=A0A6G1PB71_CHAAH|nr:Complement C3 Complement C3 beta chain Complement C3 alpha chain [Channa argus]
MKRTQLWLLASLACASLTSLTDGAPLQVMSAPNLLRVGTPEKIFVECQDCPVGEFTVDISVMNHPTKSTKLASTTVTLNTANSFQQLGEIKIPTGLFSSDPSVKQYVYLQAKFPDRMLEKVVLVSFPSGYIFIQTDKTLYTPSTKLHYRMFAVTPSMEPVERDEETDASIAIEIVTPEGIILPQDPVSLKSGIYSGDYQLGEIIRYLFGEEVDGTAYVVFGVLHEGQKRGLPSSIQRVQVTKGNGVVTLKREHITNTFPNILELVGSCIYVAASVLRESGSEMVEAELRNMPIVTSPYTIHFKKTPKYFKPGMSFDVAVEVLNPDETPAQAVAVVVNPGGVRGFTAANGMARLTINTVARDPTLIITAKTDDPILLPERQASATMTAHPYSSASNNYIHIGVDTAELQLGDNLKINLNLNRQPNQENDITYLILSRGQIIKHDRYRTRGQVLIALIVPVTKDMLPSFRIVAYYHPTDNEVVSDSVWVDVKDSCMGSIWDTVKKYDTGCTPGGGRNSMSVFYDAGLVFESSTASGTPYRQVSQYKDQLQRDCCLDGMRETPISYTCERRSEYIVDGPTCVQAFLHCCKEMGSLRAEKKEDNLKLARSEEDDNSYMDSNEIVSRTKFPESWLWTDLTLPPCPKPNCATTSSVKNVPLQDSITTWQFTGISLSRTHGICVGEPLEVIVRKEFFIDLRLPYSAVRGEQLEVKAILHNYSPDSITVRVDLTEEENICSAASKRGRYRQEVRVGPQTTRSVPFVIIPMKEGQFRIEVKAAVKDSSLNDGIMKMLRVVPEGVLVKTPITIVLDPTKNGVGGKQEETINSGIAKKDLVPNTPTSTQISVTGREQLAPLVENAISGKSMGSLIYQPSGCGEQNMIHMTLPVIATTYLDKTNQWETVGFQKRNEALQHIKTGYTNELAYRKKDGSFAVWAGYQSSSWLTAYVVKVFSMARSVVAVENEHLCEAVRFLILNAQQPDGMFKEVGTVSHGEMIGDVRGVDSDASMTAFCLIAMQESLSSCTESVNSMPESIDKAVTFLERRLPSITNPYAVAITSYALANANKLNREILYKFASPELSHWPVPKGHIYTLEATAYALLALVKTRAFEEARPVVRWFNKQQKVGGGYGSTQATIIVYQAVAEYWANAQEAPYDLSIDLTLPGRSKPDKYHFNKENHYATRTSKMVSLYYALPKEKESDCQKFNMSVELIPEKMDQDEKIYRLKIEVLYKNKEHDATMSILDIGLLTGFTVNTNDLDLLSKGRARTIAKYEMNTVLSERGSLIIYLDKVSHTRPEEITFRVHQKLKVGVLQPAVVSVYEYYDQTQCVKFYHPERRAGQLLRLCRNDECTCAEENCSMQKKGNIENDLRTAKLCESTPTSKIDFAYKVRLEQFTDGLSTDIYTVRVLEVIKEGSYDVGPLNKLRTFLSYPHCRETLALEKGKTYLIMGTSRDIHRDDQNQSYQYVLGERTWLEYWPTDAECQRDEHRPACLGIEEMVQQYELFGCQQ